MKFKVLVIIVGAITITNSCNQAQKSDSFDSVEKMIKEFYSDYCHIWNNTPTSVPANVLHEKIDSLAQKYCTEKVRNEAQKWFLNGQELFTNDYGIVPESLKNMTITKDLTKKQKYIVTYTTANMGPPGKLIEQEVILHVGVVKEKDGYRINEVK